MYRILVRTPKGKRPVGRSSVDGRIILKLILETWDELVWTGLMWFRIGSSRGLL
jgi:hypothetical protein